MKTLTRTIIVFVALSLITAGFASTQIASDEEALTAQRQAEVAQKQVEAAQKQAEAAKRQAEASLRQVAVAQQSIPGPPPEPPAPPVMPSLGLLEDTLSVLDRRLSSWPRSGSTGAVLVIPSEQIKTEDLVAVIEDMNVMARIFEKNLQQARISTARGGLFLSGDYMFGTLLGRGRGAMQSMYLQGYGALFLMKVDFPLSPPPQVEQEKETKKENGADPVWTEMKREMFEPEESRRRRTDRSEQKKYDAEKVENLKATLVKALKHAANIRSLKPDESVVLTITGSGQSAGDAMIVTTKAIVVNGENTRIVKESVPGGAGFTSHTVLVIRTKKSDIDSFAKGDLDFDQFRQRTQMFTYPLLGGAAERGGPFDLYIR